MDFFVPDPYKSLETALKGAALKVDSIVKKGKKTVITVTQHKKSKKHLSEAPKKWRGTM
ncbi:MAG: hypothetical protein FWB99_05495 [Treponema sp.]|nr:hypothetical protein [Treponema sp.]